MLNLLAQTTEFTTSDIELSSGETAGLAIFGGAFMFVWLIVVVVMIVSMWKLFEKAGKPGWAAIVPGYNGWIMAEMAGKPGWWGLVPFLGIIPVLGVIASIAGLVLYVLIAIELAKAFGKEPAYAALLILVPIVGFPMLAFGDAKYTAPAAPTATPPASTPTA